MRYVFVQDESCHWYCIPEKKLKLFNELVSIGEEADDELNNEFEKYLAGGNITNISFTNPKKIR